MEDKEEIRVPQSPHATLREAAAYMKLCTKSILNLVDRGKLKPVHIGRRRFFRWADLEKIAKHGTR